MTDIGRPEVRERMIDCMDWNDFERFRTVINRNISVSWSNDPADIFVVVSKTEVRLKPEFMKHIVQKNNWRIGQEVVDIFPFMKDVAPLIIK